jgi:hypothetical protein
MENTSTVTYDHLIKFDSRVDAQQITSDLLTQAQREICFFGNDIDLVLFANNIAVEQISELARKNSRTRIRFLVHSTQKAMTKGHPLLVLARRLTSTISIHTTSQQHKTINEQFLLVDNVAYLYMKNSLSYEGQVCFNAPLRPRTLKQDFDERWLTSQPDINVREMRL